MLSLNQCVTSAIASENNYVNVNQFNLMCDKVTDYMAATNIAFADVLLYIQQLASIKSSISTVVDNYVQGSADNFLDLVSGLYSKLTKNNLVLAASLKLVGEGDYSRYNCTYSKSSLSSIPGYNLISYDANALVSKTVFYKAVNPNPVIEGVLNNYTKVCVDPAFGQCRYGILPYIAPIIDEPVESAYPYFKAFDVAQENFDKAIDIYKATAEEERKDSYYSTHIETCSEYLFDALMHIAYCYNETHTSNLPPFKGYND
jgi:hypothetical protein